MLSDTICFDHVTVHYPEHATPALQDITFSVNTGELLAVVGSSGCGKTTLLKLVNRLLQPTTGAVCIDGKNVINYVPSELRRKIGFVFQSNNLFPHLTIKENLQIVLKAHHVPNREHLPIIKNCLITAQLQCDDALLAAWPEELSGGQQQRVAIARALVMNPLILLLDESFSALDRLTRATLQQELKNLHQQTQKTIIFVTHDIEEALFLADRIAVLHEGQLLQIDTPDRIVNVPINAYVKALFSQNTVAVGSSA